MITEEQKAKIRELRASGLSFTEIGQQLGISHTAAWNHVSPENLEASRKVRRNYYIRNHEAVLDAKKNYYYRNHEAIRSYCNRLHKTDKYRDWRRRTQLGTYIDGKHIVLSGLHKRAHPGVCEVCDRKRRLGYHHWKDSNPNLGVWLCYRCHILAEEVDRGRHLIYLKLRQKMEAVK